MSAALIRRSVAVSFLAALLLGVFAMPAFAGGRQVLADYEDNGQINGCYTLPDYEEALKLIRPDQQQYGAAVDVIRQAELTNIRRPGQACGATSASGSSADVPAGGESASAQDPSGSGDNTIEQDESGLSAVAIAIIVAVGLALAGFVIYLIASRRGGSGGEGGGDGPGRAGSA
ncbi:MAG: hypothetical protein FJW92_03705 [Actinobacteria bacterium]|nr:hypothetical protein [Actinomycetota bacterium]